MNSSPFMDKQITALAGGQSGDLLDLINQPPRGNSAASVSMSEKKDEILPSYDFQPIHRVGSSPPPPPPAVNLDSGGGSRAWGSGESKFSSPNPRNYNSVEPLESSKFMNEKGKEANDATVIAEIDHTVKKYADSLLSALEGVISRLSQLENRTRHLEASVDDLKLAVGNNAGNTDGKLRQLENVLKEVQTGVQVMRDKQDIALMKIHASSGEHQDIKKPPEPTPSQQALQQVSPQPSDAPQQRTLPGLPALLAPPTSQQNPIPAPIVPKPPQQNPAVQYSSQVPPVEVQNPPVQNPPYPPPQGQVQEHALPKYQSSVQQPPQYQMSPPTYTQAPQSTQHQPPFPQSSADLSSYIPQQQTYPPSVCPSPPPGPHPSVPPPHHFYGPSSNMYEPPPSKQNASQVPFSGGYSSYPGGPGPGFSESHPYGGPSLHYGTSLSKPPPFAPPASSSESSHPRLPTAQILPQATPVGSGSSSSTGNRVPIDDVVEKVATMGFSKDQVRATVRKLTENGQSVDLNVVLDKLMNDSETQKSWYGR